MFSFTHPFTRSGLLLRIVSGIHEQDGHGFCSLRACTAVRKKTGTFAGNSGYLCRKYVHPGVVGVQDKGCESVRKS